MTTPEQVEPGQMWKDNDQRTRGSGEFTVIGTTDTHALVRRHKTDRTSRISVERMLKGTNTQRGYTYLGRQK